MSIECSRCDQSGSKGDCFFFSNPISVSNSTSGELVHVLDSMQLDAYHNYKLYAGYDSKHDMTVFTFVQPQTNILLDNDDIRKRHLWLNNSENYICDDCLDAMIIYKEIIPSKVII